MRSWRGIVGLGFVTWLALFVVAVLVSRFRESDRPLSESLMAVAVTATAVILWLVRSRGIHSGLVRDGGLLGVIWFLMCVLLDALLMLLGGPMNTTFGDYMADC